MEVCKTGWKVGASLTVSSGAEGLSVRLSPNWTRSSSLPRGSGETEAEPPLPWELGSSGGGQLAYSAKEDGESTVEIRLFGESLIEADISVVGSAWSLTRLCLSSGCLLRYGTSSNSDR